MTASIWSGLTQITKIYLLVEWAVKKALFPSMRPQIVPVIIPVTNTNDLVITDKLRNYQLFTAVGFSSGAGPTTLTRGSALQAKIGSYTNVTLDEFNYFNDAFLQTNGFNTKDLNYSIITSDNITITLAGGHGLTEVHFYCLPATYMVAQNVNDLF